MSEQTSDAGEAARQRQSHVRHELRAPLAVMYPLLSLLLAETAGPLTAVQRENLEMLERNAERLHALIGSASESGWLDCAAAPQEPAAVPLRDVAAEVLAQLAASDMDVTRVRIVEQGPAAVAWADRDHVRFVVRDLVDNALRHAPGSEVWIRVHGGTAATIVVEDDGPGMPAGDLEQAFAFGFRGEAAREAGVPGLGAGLWVCRDLVARNGGSITLVSAAGGGTTVTVTLKAPAG